MAARQPRESDRIAREAARLYGLGHAETIPEAIRLAIQRLGRGAGPLPSDGRVRQHLQAMSMEALGEGEYRRGVRQVLAAIEQFMTTLSEQAGLGQVLLVGRAARGHVDGPGRIYLRLYSEEPIEAVAATLIAVGYDEPTFETIESRFGRLNRIIVAEEGVEIVLTRCLPSMRREADRDLFSGEKVETATLAQLRAMLG